MRIFCIGRNYAEHAAELNNPLPESPVVFMKPESALLAPGEPFVHPRFSEKVHYEVEIVLRIGTKGKEIAGSDVMRHIDGIAVGIDFTARDIQDNCKRNGYPWELAKSFDGSAALSDFHAMEKFGELSGVRFGLKQNGKLVQDGNTGLLLFRPEYLIAYISQFFALFAGDILFTGTPAGVGSVRPGDRLEAFIGDQILLTCDIK